jgi:hypothetical protein
MRALRSWTPSEERMKGCAMERSQACSREGEGCCGDPWHAGVRGSDLHESLGPSAW